MFSVATRNSLVALPLALALVLGANIGGAVAPYVAQAAGSPIARRVPLGNLLMRSLGALAVLPSMRPAMTSTSFSMIIQ